MKNFHYRFLETNKDLLVLEGSLRNIFDSVAEKIVSATEIVKVDIVVRHDPQNIIPELGISGQYTKEARRIDIYLDLDNSHLKDNLRAEVARTLVHEYMHVVREQYFEWENGTLLDSLIAEGLTQSFEIEILPNLSPAIYATAFNESELGDLWMRAKNILNQRGLVNEEWFFGSDTLRRWSGYSLGFKLVQDKIMATGLKASQLYKLPATDFIIDKKRRIL